MAHLKANNLFGVEGLTVLVTGGGSGIGLMITQGFVANGATVYICSRKAAVCEKAAEELTRHGPGRCIALPAVDLRGGKDVCYGVADMLRAKGVTQLDVLVNNSGIAWGEPLENTSESAFDKVMAVNVKALYYVTMACLPLLQKAGTLQKPARVINVGSIAGIQVQAAPTPVYDMSKAAVHHVTRKFAGVFAGSNITVNAIAPGLVPTRMGSQLFTYIDKETYERSVIPLGRVGCDSDMAGITLFLCSPAGSWVTGAVIPIDGGNLLASSFPTSRL
mmetsp:Transcript_23477/g.65921  ORF Transcript_23477/g.65921 Transcript_23477/m.65921 type:complete len:276 (-) Transcript_23477:141-968(-)|eukprot:CAMPEP_0119125548 /NCGR_PEP_ID=MMETSP1310-20130426/4779_1 /TAXON_ID=464262 /ORGANISM="Genus nov. species nov., Strain RCC2339" /LENGTH=275 /DNA_ID=CAMNT_0007115625 /DNA_START=249 /DNA_END=1076 /DNA_ORIENTATION=+